MQVGIGDPWPLANELARWLDEFTIQDPRVLQQIRGIAVHMGFWNQYNSVREAVASEVRKAVQKAPGQYDMLVAGHSMGGALARLCAFDLLGHGIAIKGRTMLVTIGSVCVCFFVYLSISQFTRQPSTDVGLMRGGRGKTGP